MKSEQMIPTYTQVAEVRCITRCATTYQLLSETITIPLSENEQQYICLFIKFLFARNFGKIIYLHSVLLQIIS